MIFQVGSTTRPLNEVVVSIKYTPKYDVSRRIISVVETWSGRGRIVLSNPSFANMTSELNAVTEMLSQRRVNLNMLTDLGGSTAMTLNAGDCFDGPNPIVVDIPTEPNDVYISGMGYSFVYQAERSPGTGLLAFDEEVALVQVGGTEFGYVGGAINMPERQVFYQNKPWRYVQRGSAVGLFGTPVIPGPIWPFALITPASPNGREGAPKIQGAIPSQYPVSWSYEYAWDQQLFGSPHFMN